MGTEFIEHFFGLVRSLLPNFTFAELLKMVKHSMLHQRLLLSGKFNAKKVCSSQVGYILDYDVTPLTNEELQQGRVSLTTYKINQIVELAYKEASAICSDILHMPVLKLPLTLVPLSGPEGPKTRNGSGNSEEEDESDKDDWDGDHKDEDEEAEFVDVEDEAGAAGAAA